MLTSPITTPHFHSSVLALLSAHLSVLESTGPEIPAPIIPPFNSVDTPLTPGDVVTQLVGCVSSWVDLCSPDPLISNISRQVLTMEIAYAAFCGVSNIIIPGPRRYSNGRDDTSGLIQYARAVQEALGVGLYVNMAIHIPMYDHADAYARDIMGDLAPFSRENYLPPTGEDTETKDTEPFSTWDAWNTIRSICDYNSRLSVGK
jgi:type II protein arginine methyltransferase